MIITCPVIDFCENEKISIIATKVQLTHDKMAAI